MLAVAGGACQIRLSRPATTDHQPRHTQRVQLRVMPRPTFLTYFVCGGGGGGGGVCHCVTHTVRVCGVVCVCVECVCKGVSVCGYVAERERERERERESCVRVCLSECV